MKKRLAIALIVVLCALIVAGAESAPTAGKIEGASGSAEHIYAIQTAKVTKEILSASQEGSQEEVSQKTSGKGSAEQTALTDEEQGLAAEMAGEWTKAVVLYKSVLAHRPARADLWLRIADIEARLGNKEEVINALKKAVELSPQDPELHFKLSQAYSVAQRPAEALEEVSIALGIDPKKTDYLLAQAELAGWLGQYDLAVKSLKQLIEHYPKSDSYLLWLARLEVWNGELDQGVRDYRAYLSGHPEDLTSQLELARAEIWRANFSASEKVLNQYRERAGETNEYWRERARLLAAARRPKAALGVIDGKFQPELSTDYEVQQSRVIALHYLNDPDEALEGLKVLERLRPLSRETTDTKRFVKTRLRDFVEGRFQYYNDSDHLSRANSRLGVGYFLSTLTTLLAGAEYDWLRARTGSGLENVDGSESARHKQLWAGISRRLGPSLVLEGRLGVARAERADVLTYRLSSSLSPADEFNITLTHAYGYYVISPKAVSLGIRQRYSGIEASWSPDFVHTVDAVLSYTAFSDDNSRWEAILGPRRAVLRSGKLNADLGVLSLWEGFEKRVNNGYYDPELYQLYALRGFAYWKMSDDDGVSATALIGLQKDDTMDSFRSAMSLDLEGTFGLYRDWMLKVRAGATNNLRQATGAFRAVIGSISLTRRF